VSAATGGYRHLVPHDNGDPLAPLRRGPAVAGIFSDFDGTLSAIVADPAAAEPVAGVPCLLDRLARRYRVVAVVSGRPVDFLAARLPSSILLAGLYGLEVRRDGQRWTDPEAERWCPVVSTATARIQAAAPPGVLVEPKGLSVTLHYRDSPALEPQVTALARQVAAATGLAARAGRKSMELLPPVHPDKGMVIRKWAPSLAAACYLGDDLGDMSAFRALDDLARRGIATARIAVASDEAPAELLQAADMTTDGPEGAVALLRTLL
jgi:trehalose 6-phosphate phosphatase